jgi:dipeptidyl aminopeptidase/acylaminoacyl peptidase
MTLSFTAGFPPLILSEVFSVRHAPHLNFLTVILFLLVAIPVLGASPARDHDIVPEDYFDLISLGNLAVSPDGGTIAYTESRWGEGKEGRHSELWTVDRDGTGPVRHTFDSFAVSSVVWSPDGEVIYFLGRDKADRDAPPHDGSRQVWRLAPGQERPTAVTRVDDGVQSFCLAPDDQALYYCVRKKEVTGEWKDLREKFEDLEYGHGVTWFTEVHKLDLRSWRDEVVLPADRVIWEMSLSPDGTRLGMITTSDNELIFKEGWSRVEILDLASGAVIRTTSQDWRTDHPSPYGWIDDLVWSGDSRALAFAISYDGYATRLWITEENDGAWDLQQVKRPDMVTYAGSMKWKGKDRTLCYRGETMGRIHVYGTENVGGGDQGKTRVFAGGDIVIGSFGFDEKGGSLTTVFETITDANDIYTVKSPEKFERLTRVNPQVDTWKLPQISHVSWPGADGDVCYGILELPPEYQTSDGPLPTIIELHGGPTSSTKYRLRLWIYGRALMASNGYALLSPNYHGSTGYGDEFLAKLIGRENEIEVTDIAAGTRWLIDQGIADPARIGVSGWSNGGYLTNCMIVAEPDLFAAASSGAGVLDMVIQWGTEDTPGHVINFVEGLPWEQSAHYEKASPLYNLDKVKTPTLIHVGGDDPRVPPAHSRALYRALKHYLHVPTELVVYPGEPHGLTTHENRLAKMKWDLAWFEKYLVDQAEEVQAED